MRVLPQWQDSGAVLRITHSPAHLLQLWRRNRYLEHGRNTTRGNKWLTRIHALGLIHTVMLFPEMSWDIPPPSDRGSLSPPLGLSEVECVFIHPHSFFLFVPHSVVCWFSPNCLLCFIGSGEAQHPSRRASKHHEQSAIYPQRTSTVLWKSIQDTWLKRNEEENNHTVVDCMVLLNVDRFII